jgi:hypothetical protein
MRSPSSLRVCVSPISILNAWTRLHETWYVYHDTWVHLNGVLHKSLTSVCLYAYHSHCYKATARLIVYLSLVLSNSSVKSFPRQPIPATIEFNCWTGYFLCGPCLIKGESVGLCPPLTLLRSTRYRRRRGNGELLEASFSTSSVP